jgi:hypothetical protein
MSGGSRWRKSGTVVWLESQGVHAGGQYRPTDAFPNEDQLAQALASLPQSPTKWIVDDLCTPTLLLKDFVELPSGTEARESFLQWRYVQHLGLEEPQSVKALEVEEGSWLLVGIPEALRESWLQLALHLKRPIHALIPRWLWIYNRIAPTRTVPGMLLSLSPTKDGRFTGTLAAWGRTLTLLRQWNEPLTPEAWMEDRVYPTAAYLQRENRSPRELLVWGAGDWPEGAFTVHRLPYEVPLQEAM